MPETQLIRRVLTVSSFAFCFGFPAFFAFVPYAVRILIGLGLKADDLPAATKFVIDLSNEITYYLGFGYGWFGIVVLVVNLFGCVLIKEELMPSASFSRATRTVGAIALWLALAITVSTIAWPLIDAKMTFHMGLNGGEGDDK